MPHLPTSTEAPPREARLPKHSLTSCPIFRLETSSFSPKSSSTTFPSSAAPFQNEASETLRDTLDSVLSLALTLPKSSPLSFCAYALFILFPRLLLRPLSNGCHGRFADAALRKRCSLLMEGKVFTLLTDSHEAQIERASSAMNSASSDPISFSKTARAAILSGSGEVGRACKVTFTCGLETNPSIAATFLAKLTPDQALALPAPLLDSQTNEEPQLPESPLRCIHRQAQEVGSPQRRLDLGVIKGRSHHTLHIYPLTSVRRALLQWISPKRPLDLPCL